MLTQLLLNLGCGVTCHKAWLNLDIEPCHPLAKRCDLRQGIPFPDSSADACYSSHVLEHLTKETGFGFLSEQFRVLKKGGVVRVVVPDLETICRNYLLFLEDGLKGVKGAEFKYDYTLLELFDQTTRSESGGDLLKLWHSEKVSDLPFVLARHGKEAEPYLLKNGSSLPNQSLIKQVLQSPLKKIIRRGCEVLVGTFAYCLLGKSGKNSVSVGFFRDRGEIHKTMYDRYSLQRTLLACGFTDAHVCTYQESRIPNFSSYGLDGDSSSQRKPDSLYIEAIKP